MSVRMPQGRRRSDHNHTSPATATLATGQAARGVEASCSDVQGSPWTLIAVYLAVWTSPA